MAGNNDWVGCAMLPNSDVLNITACTKYAQNCLI